MRRIAPALLAALLLLSACSSPSSDGASQDSTVGTEAAEDSQANAGSERDAPKEKNSKRKKKAKRENKGKNEGSQPQDQGDGENDDASTGGEGDGSPDSRAGGSGAQNDSGGEAAAPSSSGGSGPDRPDPESGRYTFAQQGWEEFCAGTCSRGDLPPSAQIDTTVSPAGAGTLQVVSESRSSEERSTETTSVVSARSVEVTRVELRYGSFSNTYDPSPPVKSLDLPLTVGESWESSWRADTSGTYSATVVGRESMVVDGTRVKTFKLDTVMHLRGQFRGTATTTMWVDPGTATAIRSRGKVRIQTDYGRFNSNFDMMLLKGPGY